MPLPTSALPTQVSSILLEKYQDSGEPTVVFALLGVGYQSDYPHRSKDGLRTFHLKFHPLTGHHIRVPLSLWQHPKLGLVKEIMEQPLPFPCSVRVEMPVAAEVQAAPVSSNITPSPDKTGATDTSGPAQNVVGLSAEPPAVAPTWKGSDVHPSASQATVVHGAGEDYQYGGKPLHEVVYNHVKNRERDNLKTRIGDLAQELQVEASVIKAAVGCEASSVELARAGWLRTKQS